MGDLMNMQSHEYVARLRLKLFGYAFLKTQVAMMLLLTHRKALDTFPNSQGLVT